MDGHLESVVARVPQLANATKLDIVPLAGGLSNVNYVATADGERFAIRLALGGSFGPNRKNEQEAVTLAAAAGIAPEVVAFFPEGHSVVRFIESARPLTTEELSDVAILPRLVQLVGDIHRLDSIKGSFSPYAQSRQFVEVAGMAEIMYPDKLQRLLDRVAETERRRRGAYVPVLCHNDPYYLNILLNHDRLWMIDWEYAGMNDPMYDLAGIGYRQDPTGKSVLLESYFGESTAELRFELDEMIAVYLCWNVAWALAQAETSQIEFDYIAFAHEMLAMVEP